MTDDIDRAAQMHAELALALGYTDPATVPEWDDLVAEVARLRTVAQNRTPQESPRVAFLRKLGKLP